jgi:hypothetical protein
MCQAAQDLARDRRLGGVLAGAISEVDVELVPGVAGSPGVLGGFDGGPAQRPRAGLRQRPGRRPHWAALAERTSSPMHRQEVRCNDDNAGMVPSSRSSRPLKIALLSVLLVLVIAAAATGALARPTGRPDPGPAAHAAATCSDYANQAAAQQAADTRDANGNGIYCESLPCPCSSAAAGGAGGGGGSSTPAPPKTSCVLTGRVQPIGFSKTKYPNIRKHYLASVAKGWPRILVLNRPDASARRERLLQDVPTRSGYDRDEYPPAVARGRGFHIRGSNPRGWKADVAYVPSHENRSHGSTMGTKLKRLCNGQKFRYVFY